MLRHVAGGSISCKCQLHVGSSKSFSQVEGYPRRNRRCGACEPFSTWWRTTLSCKVNLPQAFSLLYSGFLSSILVPEQTSLASTRLVEHLRSLTGLLNSHGPCAATRLPGVRKGISKSESAVGRLSLPVSLSFPPSLFLSRSLSASRSLKYTEEGIGGGAHLSLSLAPSLHLSRARSLSASRSLGYTKGNRRWGGRCRRDEFTSM